MYPEDKSIMEGTCVRVGCEEVVFPYTGALTLIIELFDNPNLQKRSKGFNYTQNGSKGNTTSYLWYDFCYLKPNTTYYWYVSYWDYDIGEYVHCSPIYSFTTGDE